MEAGTGSGNGEQRRPLLAGGEHLSGELERPTSWGPKSHFRSIEEAVEILTPQVSAVREEVAATPSSMRGARVVFEAKVLANYLANSNFPKELLAEADLVPVGSRSDVGEYLRKKKPAEERETKSYLLAGDEKSLTRLSALLSDEVADTRAAQKARESLRQFDLVRLPGVAQTLRGEAPPRGETTTWEAVFHPAADGRGEFSSTESDSVWRKWLDLVASLGGEVAERYRRRIKDLTFVPVRLPVEAVADAAAFNPLRAIRPMPSIRPIPVSPLRQLADPSPTPPSGERPQSDVRVAVFDGGVDLTAPQLAPFVSSSDLTAEEADTEDVLHGSLVTSTILYGSDHGAFELPTPEVGVDHFRVLPVPREENWDIEYYWILDQIENQVKAGNYKIVNLSLGPDQCLEDGQEPHAWTARLDQLAEEHDVLFINAVGNNGEADSAIGADRIQVPSDMVNGLAVGACDERPPGDPWERTLYSAVGPGRPGSRMAPTGVAFGGTDANPFRGISTGGGLVEAAGTSFATPAVTHGLSALSAQLGTVGANANVLRAFAAHCVETPDDKDLHEEVGFGRFVERYDDALDCAPNEATILYRDEIERGQMISLPFPLVQEVVDGRRVALTWTIAFSAPTDPKDPVDYTLSGLEASFRPHAEIFSFRNRETNHTQTVNVGTEPGTVTELLEAGYTVSSLPKTTTPHRFRHETLRRKEDGKWETILRQTTSKNFSSLLRPQVTVVYLAREDGEFASAPPLSFAMLLTMQTASGVDLYDAVRARFQVLTPLRARLPLRLST